MCWSAQLPPQVSPNLPQSRCSSSISLRALGPAATNLDTGVGSDCKLHQLEGLVPSTSTWSAMITESQKLLGSRPKVAQPALACAMRWLEPANPLWHPHVWMRARTRVHPVPNWPFGGNWIMLGGILHIYSRAAEQSEH